MRSRDVLGLALKEPADIPRVLFYLASPPGHAQVIRGASRQVQAHLTVERLKSVRVPRLGDRGRKLLEAAFDRLKSARVKLDHAVNGFANFVEESDPFARLQGRELHFNGKKSDRLRERLDPAHYRTSHEAAVSEATEVGWRRIGSLAALNREAATWDRSSAQPKDLIDYLPLSSIEAGTGRVTRIQRVPVWNAPGRAKWICSKNVVLVPSLLESLNRVGVVTDRESGGIASSGFHTLAAGSDRLAKFVASYLTTNGAHNQILRTGTGVRFRSYSREQLQQLLLPPESLVNDFVLHFENVSEAAVDLEAAWKDGVASLLEIVGWSARAEALDMDDLALEETEGI